MANDNARADWCLARALLKDGAGGGVMVAGTRRPEPGGRLLGYTALGLGAAYLAVASYLTLGQIVSSGKPADDRALSLEALQRLSATELQEARDAARATYEHNPLDADTLIELSRIEAAGGDAEAAERLKLLAGDMTRRDVSVQVEALTILLKRRDFDAVMVRLDGLIRARPVQAENFLSVAGEVAADPDGANAVARMLAQSPPWRGQFLSQLLAKGQADTAYKVISALRASGVAVDPAELASVIDFHLSRGDQDKAYAIWLSSLNESELKDVRLVYDGGFAHPVRSLRFDWTVKAADGFAYRTFPRNTASMDQSLQIELNGFRGHFDNLSQLLRLTPGRYRISGEARFEAFQSTTGLVFRLYCLDGGNFALLEETPALPQSSQWVAFEKTFAVPQNACSGQILRLETKTKPSDDLLISGQVAIDNVQIQRLPQLAP